MPTIVITGHMSYPRWLCALPRQFIILMPMEFMLQTTITKLINILLTKYVQHHRRNPECKCPYLQQLSFLFLQQGEALQTAGSRYTPWPLHADHMMQTFFHLLSKRQHAPYPCAHALILCACKALRIPLRFRIPKVPSSNKSENCYN